MLFLVQWHICGKFSNARKILLCSSSPADVIFSLFLQWPKELEVHTLIWSRLRKRKTFQRGVWRHVQKKGKDQKSPRLGVNPDQSKILNSDTYVLSGLVTLNKKLKNFTRVFFCGFFQKENWEMMMKMQSWSLSRNFPSIFLTTTTWSNFFCYFLAFFNCCLLLLFFLWYTYVKKSSSYLPAYGQVWLLLDFGNRKFLFNQTKVIFLLLTT